jgi:hypothetical protein
MFLNSKLVVSVISKAKAVPKKPLCDPVFFHGGLPSTLFVVRPCINAGHSDDVQDLSVSSRLRQVIPLVRRPATFLLRKLGQAIMVIA